MKKWWVEPYSEKFDAYMFLEQGFSIGKGSLNLNSLRHKGKSWEILHSTLICMVMLGAAKMFARFTRIWSQYSNSRDIRRIILAIMNFPVLKILAQSA